MLAFKADPLSLVINVAFLALTFLAAWCIGRRYNAGHLALIAVALLHSAPLTGAVYAGSAANDYIAIAFLLAAMAFAVRGDGAIGQWVLFGVAAGLALGTKLTMVVPVGGLCLLAVWLLRRRPAILVATGASVLATGGFWYLRNLLQVGSPVPSMELPLFTHPPMKVIDRFGSSVLDYATDTQFWSDFAVPGLSKFFGLAWPVLLTLAAVGLVLGLVRGGLVRRGLGLGGAVALMAYLVTPTSAGGPDGRPFLFVFNLRYAMPALVIGLILFATDRIATIRQPAVGAGLAALTAITALSDGALSTVGIVLAAALAAGTALAWPIVPRVPRPTLAAGAVAVAVLLVVVGFPAQRNYMRHRFTSTRNHRLELVAFSLEQIPAGSRVAVVGHPLQYAFYGKRLGNRVDYLGEHKANHEFTDYTDCDRWRRALAAGRYDFVAVFLSDNIGPPPAAEFMAEDPAAQTIIASQAGAIYRLTRQNTASPSMGTISSVMPCRVAVVVHRLLAHVDHEVVVDDAKATG